MQESRYVSMQLREYGAMFWLAPVSASDAFEVIEAFNELDAIYRLMSKYGVSRVYTACGWLYPSVDKDVWIENLSIPSLQS